MPKYNDNLTALALDEAITKQGIVRPQHAARQKRHTAIVGYFLSQLLQTLQDRSVNIPDISRYVHLLYQKWEHAYSSRIQLLPAVEQFNAILTYIENRKELELLRAQARINSNGHSVVASHFKMQISPP